MSGDVPCQNDARRADSRLLTTSRQPAPRPADLSASAESAGSTVRDCLPRCAPHRQARGELACTGRHADWDLNCTARPLLAVLAWVDRGDRPCQRAGHLGDECLRARGRLRRATGLHREPRRHGMADVISAPPATLHGARGCVKRQALRVPCSRVDTPSTTPVGPHTVASMRQKWETRRRFDWYTLSGNRGSGR
jgi:hypothetical protein